MKRLRDLDRRRRAVILSVMAAEDYRAPLAQAPRHIGRGVAYLAGVAAVLVLLWLLAGGS